MKKIYLLLLSFTIILALISSSHAFSFTFYDTATGGVASADMDISVAGNRLTLDLYNTSPIRLIDNSGENSPGITGFGFEVINDSIYDTGWSLVAYEYDINNSTFVSRTIGGSPNAGLDKWELTQDHTPWGKNGINLDYFSNTQQGMSDGALFNPNARFNSLPQTKFFTKAVFTIDFNSAPVLDTTLAYVRMQRVGIEGSLKLTGNPSNPVVPEPGTVGLLISLISGLFGFTGLRKKLNK